LTLVNSLPIFLYWHFWNKGISFASCIVWKSHSCVTRIAWLYIMFSADVVCLLILNLKLALLASKRNKLDALSVWMSKKFSVLCGFVFSLLVFPFIFLLCRFNSSNHLEIKDIKNQYLCSELIESNKKIDRTLTELDKENK
jgi:hypothetical protein